MEKYEKIKIVGKGSFGAAWLVRRKADGKKLIAKEVQLGGMKPKEKDEARNEVRLLSQIRHPNITQYHESAEYHSSLYIVMEFADGGDLAGKIRSQKNVRMKEPQIMNYFVQICLALNYLHERHILHRDLKCQNVFLTSNGVIKLGDFGIATVLRNTMALAHTICGTPYYFSPELCQNKPYNNKSDVWALGCILYEITTLQHAFEGKNMKVLMQKIVRGAYPPISHEYSKDLRDLISCMLARDSKDRPSINTVIKKPYVQGYICTLGKILGQGIQENRSMVSEEVQRAARIAAQDRMLVNEQQRKQRAIAMAEARQQEVVEQQDVRKKEEQERNLQDRMEKLRAEQQARMKEAHRRELEMERQRREAERREEAEREKRKKAREEELEKWRDRKKQEQKEWEAQEARRQQQNRLREKEWDRRMQELEREEKRREREQRERETEERAKAAGKAYWEMRNAAEQNKRRVEQQEHRMPPHIPQQQQQQRHHHHQNHSNEKKMSEQELLKMQRDAFLEMKREAARNKARIEANLREEQSPTPAAVAPCNPSPSPSREKDCRPSDAERKQAFIEMRREAQRNKERFEADIRGVPDPWGGMKEETPDDEDLDQWVNDEVVSEAEPTPREQIVVEYRDMLNQIEAIKNNERGMRPDDEEFGDSPEEVGDGMIMSKFILDGKTLQLPNVKADDPLMYRIEALRMFLSEELGEDRFLRAYRKLDGISEDASDQSLQEVEGILGPQVHLLSLVSQLIFCEDQFNMQQNKPPRPAP